MTRSGEAIRSGPRLPKVLFLAIRRGSGSSLTRSEEACRSGPRLPKASSEPEPEPEPRAHCPEPRAQSPEPEPRARARAQSQSQSQSQGQSQSQSQGHASQSLKLSCFPNAYCRLVKACQSETSVAKCAWALTRLGRGARRILRRLISCVWLEIRFVVERLNVRKALQLQSQRNPSGRAGLLLI